MGTQMQTGLSATRAAQTTPDSTFVWDVTEDDGELTVKVYFGGGTDISNVGRAIIPAGSEAKVPLSATSNPAIIVVGQVWAEWSSDRRSYVVRFSGQMVRGNFNNILSSDQNGAAQDDYPIIVYAYLDD